MKIYRKSQKNSKSFPKKIVSKFQRIFQLLEHFEKFPKKKSGNFKKIPEKFQELSENFGKVRKIYKKFQENLEASENSRKL